MSRVLTFLLLNAPSVLLGTQAISLPPASALDGVPVHHAGINAGASYWGNESALGAYRISGDGYQKPITPGKPDNTLGLVWNTAQPAPFEAARQSLNQSGGTMRVIFLGETAGWLNDFGYTRSMGVATGTDAYTTWRSIQSYGAHKNITFGDYFDLSLEVGEMNNIDLWLKANGSWQKSLCGSEYTGGVYTLFDSPAATGDASQFLWADRSLAVDTWIPSAAAALPVETWLVGAEDWRLDRGADGDFNDFRFAIQFLNADGTPLAIIPEPSQFPLLISLGVFAALLKSRKRFLFRRAF